MVRPIGASGRWQMIDHAGRLPFQVTSSTEQSSWPYLWLIFLKFYPMSRNKSSSFLFFTFVLITVFSVVSCKDNSGKSSCYDALIEAGVSKYKAEEHCYGPRD